MNAELRSAIVKTATDIGIDPIDLATVMSYETAGTFDPWKKGPTTQWGTHRGLIQWGEPQARKYGVTKDTPVSQQVEAAGRYLKDAGVRPGMGILDVYSAINAGSVGRYNASDANNGGAPGTVRDKVESQMAGHRQNAMKLIGSVQTAQAGGFDPSAFGAIALDGDTPSTANANAAADATERMAAGGMTAPATPAPLPTDRPGYQVQRPSEPVPFDPVAAGATPFDPVAAGAQPAEASPQHLDFDGSNVEGYNPETGMVERTGPMDKVGAFLSGVTDLPVVGPAIQSGIRNVAAGAVSPFVDETFPEVRDDMRRNQEQVVGDNPNWATGGQVVGAVGTMIPLGATQIGGRALGVVGNSLGQRALASGTTNALISATDTAVRGGNDEDVAKSALISGAIGGAVPVVGAGLNAVGRSVRDVVGPRLNALVNPTGEAGRRVGRAIELDRANPVAQPLNAADEASAAINNQNLMNVDRGGETTRALARSAANTDPEAREIIARTASDRFGSQGERAQSFINRIMGGATDDLALQDRIRAAAQSTNRPAYNKAYSAPAAQSMWDEGFEQLMQAPAMQQAARQATGRGANRAAVEGFQPIRNPFAEVDGRLTLRQNPDGSIARPTLQFWDQVKRNLDSRISVAQRAGDKPMAADLTALKGQLVSKLDGAVPEYQTARQGAAAFFGAEDAIDAGRKFVTANKTIPETTRALSRMAPAERDAFAVGFASELKDGIASARDRMNVIDKIFGSQQAREKVRLALGNARYKEFEQFVRVEHAMDMLRGAMGNSTTARQLVELGLAGSAGTGAGLITGDWKTGIGAALLVRGSRAYGAKVDEKIAKQVAELLIADDPRKIEQAVKLAAGNPQAAKAIEGMQRFMSAAVKGATVVGTRPPTQIDVGRPATP